MYQIVIPSPVEKVLQRIRDKALRDRLIQSIETLSDDPRPSGCKKLTGHTDLYRVRKGDWRIVYSIQDDQLFVWIIEVTTRGNAYKNI